MATAGELESKAKLTDPQQRGFQEWLATHVPDLKCPVCGHREWAPPEYFVRVQVADQLMGGLGMPLLPQTCTYCANVLFFNAIVVGLAPSLEEEKAAKQSKTARGSNA